MPTKIMTMSDALAELGVGPDTLTAEQRRQLDEDGYGVFPSLLDTATVDELRAKMVEIEEAEDSWGWGTRWGGDGGIRVDDVNHKGAVFDQLWTHPILLACMHHYLGDFRLSSMTERSPKPGLGHQGLHMDWWGAVEERYMACNSTWLLDDFNEASGTTRVVPGSHRWRKRPADVVDDTVAPYPDEVHIEAPAGSLVVFNGYTWHSGTKNTTNAARRGLFTVYSVRDTQRQNNQGAMCTRATGERLSVAARYVLDVPLHSAAPM